ncbi:efflux RND transporter periplasmic adaptor subunit [Carboxylicivirga sp. N1Y90]|uniref:efflux RND transporter periplasmic adaptor subunit n=1 Tax=Carboxylicivirga fragile TaxID=3417571 RepID=UPI003D34306F|nr:HlyD family efflux transporter periplasmic adaptor subunit [Marinilabiliaceae bacterium N1Y90]
MKKTILISIAIVLSLIAVFAVKALPSKDESKNKPEQKKGLLVDVIYPEAGNIEHTYSATGKIRAVNRFEIFAQVEGQLLPSALQFKEGNTYNKGEVILELDQQEYNMSLLAQKSDFITLLTSILPDIKSDYPDSYSIWRNYVLQLDVNKSLADIPNPKSEQEKFYLYGKGIYKSYYNVRSGEEKLQKYTIRAPFNGVVTSVSAEAGTAVRPGAALGTMLSTEAYDLEITIPLASMGKIDVGTQAKLHSSELPNNWTGKVVRVGGDIDEQSQSVKLFIRTQGKQLKEGMYLTADIQQAPFIGTMSLPRKMINDQNQLFVVENNQLKKLQVEVLSRQGDLAIIKGLNEGTAVLSTVVKSAYHGMPVRINQQ